MHPLQKKGRKIERPMHESFHKDGFFIFQGLKEGKKDFNDFG